MWLYNFLLLQSAKSDGSTSQVMLVIWIALVVIGGPWLVSRIRRKWGKGSRNQLSTPGAGGQSTENAAAALPKNEPVTSPTIFITYRREDSSDVAGRIYDRLCSQFGSQTVFKDVDSIPLGVDFRKYLDESVGKCNVLLAVIGRHWLRGEQGSQRLEDAGDFVRIELEAALKRDIPIIPVLVQGAVLPVENELPATLQSLVYRNGIPVRPDPDFHNDMDRLIKGIEGYLKGDV
ncbi:MAG TPA: toll/interleukin-1 receptor domain-containing protein [Pyrinomonadaceae bacterium]|nr:toll/interleukin-1 receptor domain-containing protein [Pyrinomonadaceae bacterium]